MHARRQVILRIFLICLSICFTSANSFATELLEISDLSQCATLLTDSPLPASYGFRVVKWRNPFISLPQGAFAIHLDVNDQDKILYDLSMQNGGIEMAVLDAFDSSGRKILESKIISGIKGHIPHSTYQPVWDEFTTQLREKYQKEVRVVRFTHTHPDTFFSFPHELSHGDLGAAQWMRSQLDTSFMTPVNNLEHVALEMTAIAYATATIGEVLKEPTLRKKFKKSFEKYYYKPAVVFPGSSGVLPHP